jgi:hypothetical protein
MFSYYEYAIAFTVVPVQKNQSDKQEDELDAILDGDNNNNNASSHSGRPANQRYKFHSSHPLYGLYEQKARSKIPCPKFAGPSPPKQPPQLQSGKKPNAAWKRSKAAYARYMLANFRPWQSDGNPGKLSPKELNKFISSLKSDATAQQPHNSSNESDLNGIQCAKTIALGRLFAMDNVTHASSVNAVNKKNLAKYRGRNRQLWEQDEKNGMKSNDGSSTSTSADSTSTDDDKKAAKLIDDCRAAQESKTFDPRRINSAGASQIWLDKLNENFTAPCNSISSKWTYSKNVVGDSYLKADKKQIEKVLTNLKSSLEVEPEMDDDNDNDDDVNLMRDDNAFEGNNVANNSSSSNSTLHSGWLPKSFCPITDEEFAKEKDAWLSGGKCTAPPLNSGQRKIGAELIPHLLALKAARSQANESLSHRPGQVDSEPHLYFLHGAAGTGKSVLIAELKRVLKTYDLGTMLATAYTGIASQPLPQGLTMCSLFGLQGTMTSTDKITPQASVELMDKFKKRVGDPQKIVYPSHR